VGSGLAIRVDFNPARRKLGRMDSVILAQEALKLPAWERAQIIDTLWRSLDPAEQASIDRAWLAECRDRLEAHRAGKLGTVDGEETLRAIEDELRK
jgi:putative addiction module component (TIGR02574 family)